MFGMKPTAATSSSRIVKVGIVGCGMVTQVVHVPTMNHLSHLFQVTYLCDVSEDATKHSQLHVAGSAKPKTTRSVEELCNAPDVDLVMIASNHAFHASDAVLALQANKSVFIEKPIALTLQDTDRIIAADKAAGGSKVFVGYMRRYAAGFVDAVKEVESIRPIRYARVRDIIGPNSVFVEQSGTHPQTFTDYSEIDSEALRAKTREDIEQALQAELGVPVTEETDMMWQMLSVLGSHDLSAMREIIGMPQGVVGFSPCATVGAPFWSAIFQYPDFAVAYESGVDQVPRFDASIEIFGDAKTIKVCIDTPFIKGLPTTVVVKESLSDGSYRESTTRRTYEDPFTLELKAVYEWVVDGKGPKTTPNDARKDLEILGMLMKAGVRKFHHASRPPQPPLQGFTISSIWFITGISSGFGLQIALQALKQGHQVIGTLRNRQKAADAVHAIEQGGGQVLGVDVPKHDQCVEVWDAAEKIHGHIDVLCNNAGMSYKGAMEDYTNAEVHAQMDVSLYGPYRRIRAALPGFRKRKSGTIIDVSSVSGIDGAIASGLQAASKFALEGLSEDLTRELAEYNINVLVVEPGAFRTNFLGAFQENNKAHLEDYSTEKQAKTIFQSCFGKQKGDPVKAATRIVEAGGGQGMTGHLKGKILRLPLGPDCLGRFEAKVNSLSTDLERVRDIAVTTNIDE